MELILLKAIEELAAKDEFRFHTPGHKGTLSSFDVTELDDFPGGLVAAAQNKTADRYHSRFCRYLTNGSSMGVKAAVMAAGGDIIAFSGFHPCVKEACRLAGVKLYVYEIPAEQELYRQPEPEDIEKALDAYPGAKAVLLTTPDYFGRTVSAAAVAAVKARNKLLIVDSAHGAHFCFRPDLFPPSLAAEADFCNLSAHKTLPAYTQSAYLCVNNENYIDAVDEALKLLGTTSPSYLFLSGLEYAAEYAAEFAPHYTTLKIAVDDLRSNIKTLWSDDFTRIAIDAGTGGGKRLYYALREAGVFAELYTDRYVLFIVTIMDSVRTVDALKKALLAAF